ncbi:imelysin family protein [Devosia sp.]|uniref:imelysin family protein n=1 Tax=Devosia sp. TaxID=1871048 RepID=UPI003A8D5C56
MRIVLSLLVLPFLAVPAMAQSDSDIVRAAIDDVFRPAFADFNAATGALESDMEFLCEAPSVQRATAARAQFRETVLSWSRAELYRLGPLLEDNRSERILFWPDRKGVALRQVQAALAEQDETATSVESLTQKSVALQGLGALEFVLFGTGSEALDDGADYRCRFGLAIAGALHQVAGELDAAWQAPDGIAKRLLQPTEGDPEYRNQREVMEDVTGLLAHGSEIIRDQRLLPFLGREGERSRPRSALFWRSNMSVPSALANFEGLDDLFTRSGIGAVDEENEWVSNGITFELENAVRAGALVTDPVAEALDDPEQKQALDYLVIVTQSLDTLLGENLAAARGLSVGFSSLDGD